MKKALVLLIFLVFYTSFIFCEETIDSLNFDIVLQRSGKTEYYFTKYNTDVRLDRVLFSSSLEIQDPAIAELGFVWAIYNSGTYNLDIIFQSAESVSLDYSDEDFMIRYTENKSIGYNYNVNILGPSGQIESVLSFEKESIKELQNKNARTCSVLKNQFINRTEGNTGRIDLQLVLNPPSSSDGTVGFTAGQYTGEIVVELTSK